MRVPTTTTWTTLALAAAAAVWALGQPRAAMACGGFFCDAVSLVPIIQAGERIVFVRDGDGTTVHVEIQFEGDSDNFRARSTIN